MYYKQFWSRPLQVTTVNILWITFHAPLAKVARQKNWEVFSTFLYFFWIFKKQIFFYMHIFPKLVHCVGGTWVLSGLSPLLLQKLAVANPSHTSFTQVICPTCLHLSYSSYFCYSSCSCFYYFDLIHKSFASWNLQSISFSPARMTVRLATKTLNQSLHILFVWKPNSTLYHKKESDRTQIISIM